MTRALWSLMEMMPSDYQDMNRLLDYEQVAVQSGSTVAPNMTLYDRRHGVFAQPPPDAGGSSTAFFHD
jgi:hypothetical protein